MTLIEEMNVVAWQLFRLIAFPNIVRYRSLLTSRLSVDSILCRHVILL